VVWDRANADKPNMGLTTWKAAPDGGRISAEIARTHAETEFEKYRIIQDRLFMSDYDKFLEELEAAAKKDIRGGDGK
jgi:hypothetical protein